MSTGGSSSNVFDLRSERGIVDLLAVIRKANIKSDEKRFLRDLVMAYTQTKGDKGVHDELVERIKHYQLTPALLNEDSVKVNDDKGVKSSVDSTTSATNEKSAPVIHSGFSGGRSVPVFSPQPIQSASTTPAEPNTPSNSAEPLTTNAKQSVAVKETADINPVKAVTGISSRPAAVTEETNTPPKETVPVPVVPTSSSSAPVTTDTTEVTDKPTQPARNTATPLDDNSQYLTRIQEIKSDINKQVGNPVNLVDINNQVGREYMSALLEAMKALSSGAGPLSAMQRLETAYQAALSVTKEASVPETSAVGVEGEGQVDPGQKISPNMPVTPSPTPIQVPTPAEAEVPDINTDTTTTKTVVESEAPVTPIPSAPITNTTQPSTPTPIVASPAPELKPVSTPESNAVPIQPTPVVTDENQPETVPIKSSRLDVSSVAEAAPLRKITDLPLATEVQTAPAGTDPLFTKEIDDGLDQLLSEWPLFSKSGLLGRGPSQREHPLFIQLANMPIPLILTGRFEGATPQVMQSISDYMNGWRYEQGLVYDSDEAFEHFLRRVIRHILNWQRKQKKA